MRENTDRLSANNPVEIVLREPAFVSNQQRINDILRQLELYENAKNDHEVTTASSETNKPVVYTYDLS